MARLQLKLGNEDECEALQQRVLDMRRAALGMHHEDTHRSAMDVYSRLRQVASCEGSAGWEGWQPTRRVSSRFVAFRPMGRECGEGAWMVSEGRREGRLERDGPGLTTPPPLPLHVPLPPARQVRQRGIIGFGNEKGFHSAMAHAMATCFEMLQHASEEGEKRGVTLSKSLQGMADHVFQVRRCSSGQLLESPPLSHLPPH